MSSFLWVGHWISLIYKLTIWFNDAFYVIFGIWCMYGHPGFKSPLSQIIKKRIMHVCVYLYVYVSLCNIHSWHCHKKSCWSLINYWLSQKFKRLGNDEFNYLTIILTLPFICGPRLSLDKRGLAHGFFNLFFFLDNVGTFLRKSFGITSSE